MYIEQVRDIQMAMDYCDRASTDLLEVALSRANAKEGMQLEEALGDVDDMARARTDLGSVHLCMLKVLLKNRRGVLSSSTGLPPDWRRYVGEGIWCGVGVLVWIGYGMYACVVCV